MDRARSREPRASRQFALPVIERLAALPAQGTWGEWIAQLETLAPMVLRRPERVLAVLAELRAARPDRAGDARRGARRAGRGAERRSPSGRRTTRYGRVFVGTLEQARGRSVRRRRSCPGWPSASSRRSRARIPSCSTRCGGSWVAGLRRRTSAASTSACCCAWPSARPRGALHLSYSRLELTEARPRVPSFYALEVMRALTGSIPDPQTLEREAAAAAGARLAWPAPDDPARAIDEVEHDLASLRALLRPAARDARAARAICFELNDHLARSLRTRWARWQPHASRPTTASSRWRRHARRSWLASRLNARAYSRLGAPALRGVPVPVLSLRDLPPGAARGDRPLERLDPLTRGSLFHEVQAECLRALQRSRPPAADRRDGVGRGADDARSRRSTASPRRITSSSRRRSSASGRTRWSRCARPAHVARAVGRATQAQWEPIAFELAFGLPRGPAHDPRSMRTRSGDARGLATARHHRPRRAQARRARTSASPTTRRGATAPAHGIVGGRARRSSRCSTASRWSRSWRASVVQSRLYYCTRAGGFSERVVPMAEEARARGSPGR